jgi:heme-degrading monooxygenase HmoA
MLMVLFRSKLAEGTGGDYHEMAGEMLATAREMPGFVDFKSYRAEDGERVSIVTWQDEATMTAWREHPRHRVAQGLGRERWYEWYRVDVTEVIRTSEFQRTE